MSSTINANSTAGGGIITTADASGVLALQTAGVTGLTIDASQNVGIGTTTPTNKLTVAGGIDFSGSTFSGSGTGIWQQATNVLGFVTAGSTRAVIDASGNVGIGTSSPTQKLSVVGTVYSSGSNGFAVGDGSVFAPSTFNNIPNYGIGYLTTGSSTTLASFGNMKFYTAQVLAMSIDQSGLFQFNSGYGSVATAYGCRAWVNFNGTGTVAIRASGNVSSITDNGVGDYTVNFTTAMPDGNYGAAISSKRTITGQGGIAYPTAGTSTGATDGAGGMLAGSCRARFIDNAGTPFDMEVACITIFR